MLNDIKCIEKHQVRISEHYWKVTTDNQSMGIKLDTVASNALLGIFFIEIRYLSTITSYLIGKKMLQTG